MSKIDEGTANSAQTLLQYAAYSLETAGFDEPSDLSPSQQLQAHVELAEAVAHTLQTFTRRWRTLLAHSTGDEIVWPG